MAISNFEKLTIILHKFGIDFNEFNMKFENIESQDASIVLNQQIILIPQQPSTWLPYNLLFDPVIPVSSSHLGNGVYQYKNPNGQYPILSGSNPINSVKGSVVFWVSSSVDNGTFTFMEPVPYSGSNPQLTVSPYLDGIAFSLAGSKNVVTPLAPKIPFGQWGLVVITQNEVEHKIYQQGVLIYTGTNGNLAGTLGLFLYDHIVANIAFTNAELTPLQVTQLYEAQVTANYTKVLGFTPEAYWRGAPVTGSPSYVPNEVF